MFHSHLHMSQPTKHLLKIAAVSTVVALLASCQNATHIKGLPKELPVINLHGSASTPSHNMSHADYPFASNGDYQSEWAAEGGQGAGMDYSAWRSSHGSSSRFRSRSSKSSSSKKSSSKAGSYTIKGGDTLGAIARRNGTTVARLKAANGLKSDLIRAGKTLRIPR